MVALSPVVAPVGGRPTPPDWAILPPAGLDAWRPTQPRDGREVDVATSQDPHDRQPAAPGARGPSAPGLAASLGAQDVLLFRRLGAGEWFHTNGVGRRPGWAGTLAVDEGDGSSEPLLAQALRSPASVRVLAGAPVRVAGPYWAGTAVVLRLGPDLLGVWGHPGRSERLLAATDDQLRSAAARLEELHDSAPARRLSDELQVLHAVQALTGSLDQPLPRVLERVAAVVAEALDATMAAVWLGDGRYAVACPGRPAPRDPAAVVAAAAGAAPSASAGALVCQDSSRGPLPPPLSPADGVRSHLLLGLDVPGGGGVVAVRGAREGASAGEDRTRGFSALRQHIATQLVGTAGTLLQVAVAREQVERQLSETRLQLGRDALTDVGSRHRWDEELAAAQELVDGGVPVAVAMLDLDDLKWVNDTHGHPAGDELLRECASAVRGCLRGSSDVVARVGGDEFAVLVPRATDVEALTARLRGGVEDARTPSGLALRVSVGVACCLPGQRVADAFAQADAAMYADKRRRRARRASA
jgi:diguanylate cyclase (GGDEF)-like protein